jgi:YD repeat-containing protein
VFADNGAHSISFTYNADGQIETVTDHEGRSLSFSYNGSGDLVASVDVLGQTWEYLYDSEHRLLSVIDPDDRVKVENKYYVPPIINFNDYTLTSYSNQDGNHTFNIEDNGATLYLQGNTWKKIDFPYTVTPNTIIEFDFKSTVQGEQHGLGLDNDDSIDNGRIFQLYGTDTGGGKVLEYNNYAASAPDWKHYKIYPYNYYRGKTFDLTAGNMYLFFMNDHDIADPTGESYFSNVRIYESTEPINKVTHQYNGEGDLVVHLEYETDWQTGVLTTSIADALGNVTIHTYDERGTLVSNENAVGGELGKVYDHNFRPQTITDGNGNTTNLTWSADGTNLTKIVNADGLGVTDIIYDSLNNPTSVVDPLNFETKYFYEDPNFPSLPTRIEYPLSFDGGITWIGTDYEYYPPSSGASAGKVKLVTDALGNQTHYIYTSSGQVETVTTGYQTPDALTTEYNYDALGRITQVTDPANIVTGNEYDAAGRLTKTIHNVHPTNTTQNYQGKYNIVTEYRYDAHGNQIAVINTDGVIIRTWYDLANRPVTVVQNLTGQTIETASPPARGSGITDENIRTDTVYDDAGNVIATIDPANIYTRTYYDEANRPKLIVQNWSGSDLYGGITTAPAYSPALPDQNVRTEYFYDLGGNVIAVKDTLGVITRTYYDAMNRPVSVVQNLSGQDVSVETPPSRGSNSNIRTDTYYDLNGNMIAMVDPKGVITRTYYDALNRPVTVVQNLSGQGINDPTPPPAGATDANIRTDTYYDEAGNVIATVDPRGIVTRTWYDSTNRPVATVQNFTGNILAPNPPQRGSENSIENARTDIAYDSFGRRDTVTDPRGHVTKYEYRWNGKSRV